MDELSRDEKLAHFEAATGILDIEECLAILESCNWNVDEAVKSALDGSIQHNIQQSVREEEVFDTEDVQMAASDDPPSAPIVTHRSVSTSFMPGPFDDSTDMYDPSLPKRMLEFAVQYGNRVFTVTLSDRETIGTLKEQVRLETGVPIEQQCYHCDALYSSSYAYSAAVFPKDDVILATLHLPKYISCLLLVDPPRSGATAASSSIPTPTSTPTESAACSSSSPQRNGSSRTQDGASRCVALDDAKASLTTQASSNSSRETHRQFSQLSNADNATESFEDDEPLCPDDFEDHEDASQNDEVTRRKQINERLMPAQIVDEREAAGNFIRVFEQRYSVPSVFYDGTLGEAVQKAYSGPLSLRRPLIIYLHHDVSVYAHIFCSDVLRRPDVNDLLRDRFYVIPGDVTDREQCSRIMGILSPHLGSVVTSPFRFAEPDKFPVLLVLGRDGRTFELRRVFHASELHAASGTDEFVSYLMATRCQFDDTISDLRQVEVERARREETRREQDAAYNESAAQDAQRIAAHEEQLEVQRARERRVANARERVLPEPRVDESDCVALKFRHPEGVLTRRFTRSSTLQALLDFLDSEGFCVPDDYHACFGFPKRFLTSAEPLRTLADLGFAAQELITLERV